MVESARPRLPRRDPTRDERLDVLRMLERGTITADEAELLLEALDRTDASSPAPPPANGAAGAEPARLVRIRISEGRSGITKINLAIPLGLVDAGLAIAGRFAPDRLLDAAAIRQRMAAGFQGSLLDIDDGNERVEIIIE